MFQGFYEETIQFLWELRLNNQRPWFQAHKQEYLDYLYHPMKELGAEVQGRMMERYPRSGLNLRVVRIYRDARRIHSGGPYKEHLWFTLSTAVGELASAPVFYFEVMPEGYEYGMGYYCPRPSLMAAYRQQILAAPAQLERLAPEAEPPVPVRSGGGGIQTAQGAGLSPAGPLVNRKTLSLSAAYPPDDCFLTRL